MGKKFLVKFLSWGTTNLVKRPSGTFLRDNFLRNSRVAAGRQTLRTSAVVIESPRVRPAFRPPQPVLLLPYQSERNGVKKTRAVLPLLFPIQAGGGLLHYSFHCQPVRGSANPALRPDLEVVYQVVPSVRCRQFIGPNCLTCPASTLVRAHQGTRPYEVWAQLP